MAVWKLSQALKDKITHFASFPQTGVSLRQMVMFGQNPSAGTLLRAGEFLQEELPIRLAHRVKELNELPNRLNEMPSILKVRDWYAQSFELPPEIISHFEKAMTKGTPLPAVTPNPSLPPHMQRPLIDTKGKHRIGIEKRYYVDLGEIIWPPEVHDYNERFTQVLSDIKRRHDPVVTTVAQGILEYKEFLKGPGRTSQSRPTAKNPSVIDRSVQTFLDRFYMSRIGIRVLIGQHIALNKLDPHPDYVGVICTNTNIYEICREAIDNAMFICEDHYGLFKGPPVQLVCPKKLNFMYLPSHLNHMVFEVLKNSLRAVVEKCGADSDEFPPIKVIVAEGQEDITIKISDEGGGIPRSAMGLVWTYMYTTAETQRLDQDFEGTDFKAPMAGFGYGLSIARLYAQYFGGNLKLISMEGYGTDVYLHLSRLSTSSEPLQ
ncbi:pyruvate dehydrogenase kinase [Phakopsora pachyrhizi]|nr:pyruvate dehydrogenase kinase [Phakopsora pachyrhizi]